MNQRDARALVFWWDCYSEDLTDVQSAKLLICLVHAYIRGRKWSWNNHFEDVIRTVFKELQERAYLSNRLAKLGFADGISALENMLKLLQTSRSELAERIRVRLYSKYVKR